MSGGFGFFISNSGDVQNPTSPQPRKQSIPGERADRVLRASRVCSDSGSHVEKIFLNMIPKP